MYLQLHEVYASNIANMLSYTGVTANLALLIAIANYITAAT